MVFFCITMYFVIHQATQNLNYGPVMQSQGHQSMSVGTALFKLWFPVLVFRNLVWCFPIGPRFYLNWCLEANRPHLLQQQLYSVDRYPSKAVLLFYPGNFKLPATLPLLPGLLMFVVRLLCNCSYVCSSIIV